MHKPSRPKFDRTSRYPVSQRHGSIDDQRPGVLPHLMLAQPLTLVQYYKDGASALILEHDTRVLLSVWRLNS